MRSTDRMAQALAALVLGVLVVQFLLGMDVNLFVSLPRSTSAADARGAGMSSAMANPALMTHMMGGLLLAVLAVLAVLAAAATRRPAVLASAAGGAVAVAVAGAAGVRFLMYGHGNDASFVMASAFMFAVIGFVTELACLGWGAPVRPPHSSGSRPEDSVRLTAGRQPHA